MSDRLVVLANELGNTSSLRCLLESRGLATATCPTGGDLLADNPCAIILALAHPVDPVIQIIRALRDSDYSGSICVLGLVPPELHERQQLSTLRAWFIPAFDGDSVIAARLLQIVC